MSVITDALNASTSTASSATAAVAGPSATASASDIENRFLTLLVTQLKNQDPLNPMDNAQLTTQLAQISTVSGIDKLNTTMNSLSSSFTAGQSVQASTMIGHSVLVNGSNLSLNGGTANGAVNLSGAADKLTITIVDAGGNVVRHLGLGAQIAGTVPFGWDGRSDAGNTAPDGSYTIQVQAALGAQQVGATPLTIGQVVGVSVGTQGLSVSVTGVGDVKLADVQRIM